MKEVMGKGGCIDLTNMEKTFSNTVITEGKKQGYLSALQVTDEMWRHEALDPEAVIEMPDISTILED